MSGNHDVIGVKNPWMVPRRCSARVAYNVPVPLMSPGGRARSLILSVFLFDLSYGILCTTKAASRPEFAAQNNNGVAK